MLANLPEAGLRHGYDDARQQLLDYTATCSDIRSVYEFGTVKAPGVSDLDFVIVVTDDPSPRLPAMLAQANLPPLVVRLMNGGTLMVMRAAEFRDMRWWDDVSVRLLSGERIDFEEPAPDLIAAVEKARVIDWLPERMARLLLISKQDAIPAQQLLCVLHSVSYTFSRLQKCFSISPVGMKECLADIAWLRGNWFDVPAQEQRDKLVGLLDRALEAGFLGLHQFARLYGDEMGVDHVQCHNTLHFGSRMRLIFSDLDVVSLDHARQLSTSAAAVVPVPAVFLPHFAAYAGGSGLVSAGLSASLGPLPPGLPALDAAMTTVLSKRIGHSNRMAAFLRQNSFQSGLWKLGWFL